MRTKARVLQVNLSKETYAVLNDLKTKYLLEYGRRVSFDELILGIISNKVEKNGSRNK